jgi:fucose 4-O-acetylase-like acetyltransferase
MKLLLAAGVSEKFKFWSFASMFLLVFVHGYNLHNRYLQPWTMVEEPQTVNTYLQYFLANGIFRFRIPMLFIISGYLYALHDVQPYVIRTKKRLLTLLLPYLIWSAVGLGFTYCLELFTTTKSLVQSSHLMQIDNQRMFLHEYKWVEVLYYWLVAPASYQLWFIRVLLVYNIAYPLLRWLVTNKYAKWVFFPIVIFLWLATFGLFFIDGEGLLFFSLGIYLQKTNFNISQPQKWLKPLPWAIVFVASAAIKTRLAFVGYQAMGNWMYAMVLLHKLIVFSGVIAAWYGCNALVIWSMKRQWFVWLTGFSFIIYALHVPMVTYSIDGMLMLLHSLPHYRLLTFIVLPLLIIAVSIIVGALLKKIVPKLYSLLTGGRGM